MHHLHHVKLKVFGPTKAKYINSPNIGKETPQKLMHEGWKLNF